MIEVCQIDRYIQNVDRKKAKEKKEELCIVRQLKIDRQYIDKENMYIYYKARQIKINRYLDMEMKEGIARYRNRRQIEIAIHVVRKIETLIEKE